MKPSFSWMVGLVIVAALCTVLVSAYVMRWVIMIYGTISILDGLLGGALLLISLITLHKAKTKESPQLRESGRKVFLASIFFLLQLAYLPVATTLRNLEVRRAQRFVESLVPMLEDYNHQHNAYPSDVSSVLAADTIYPPLLQLKTTFPYIYDNRQFYVRDAETYSFWFYLPDGFIGHQYMYCCGPDAVWRITF